MAGPFSIGFSAGFLLWAISLETGSLRDEELDEIRLDMEAEMEDECRIFRVVTKAELQPDGSKGFDEETEIYEGMCSISPIIARRDRFDEFGQGLVFSVQYRLTVPWDTTALRITDRVEMTVTQDPDFAGRNFEVRDIHRTTDISQRRVTVHDLDR